jgi:FtsP/CotA-like multicopper oxidase with cupredoxin domain
MRDSTEKLGTRDAGAEQNEALLASEDGDLEKLRASAQPALRRKRNWILITLSVVVLTVIVLFDVRLLFQPDRPNSPDPESALADTAPLSPELEALMHKPFKRPEEEYILDAKWDFAAPPQVRYYNWTIVNKVGNPDGVSKPMMMINGQFPGPMMEVNEGDTIVVDVLNMAKNSTALHWHGIFQNGTNFMDGATGATQCPIPPGQSFQYKFTVNNQSGTYYYHGHQGVQSLEGLVGPLVIHGREEAEQLLVYSTDRVILLQDWYYDPADGLLRDTLSPGSEGSPMANGALINGLNQADCSQHPNRTCDTKGSHLPTMAMDAGAYHRLRFINAGGFAWFQVSIDEHLRLLVIEVDGARVEKFQEADVALAPGQRYSVVFATDQADLDTATYWMRARMITSCMSKSRVPENGFDEAKAILRYVMPGSSETAVKLNNTFQALPTSNNTLANYLMICRDMTSYNVYKPSPPEPAPEVADRSLYLRVNMARGDWRLERGFLNGTSVRPDLKAPTLHRILDGLASGNESFGATGVNTAAFHADHELVMAGDGIETVDVVLQNFDEGAHPFHLHGTRMWVLAQGHAYFPGYEALNLRPGGRGLLDPSNRTIIANPLKRDTVTVEGFGWQLIRFVADNPGVWLFHCHIVWHGEAGMGMSFVNRLGDMRNWTVPEASRKLCEAPRDVLELGAPPKDEIFAGFPDDDE